MVVVVSAMSKVTDLLLDTLHAAERVIRSKWRRISSSWNRGMSRPAGHSECDRLSHAICEIGILVGEFQRIAHGMLMLGEQPPRSVDEAIATGERLVRDDDGFLPYCRYSPEAVNAAEVIVTDMSSGNANPLLWTRPRKGPARVDADPRLGRHPDLTGFNGATEDGRPNDAGPRRIGFLRDPASVLDAEELWIWSDVDGIMTADPRLVPDARCWTKLRTGKRPSSPITARKCCIRERWLP